MLWRYNIVMSIAALVASTAAQSGDTVLVVSSETHDIGEIDTQVESIEQGSLDEFTTEIEQEPLVNDNDISDSRQATAEESQASYENELAAVPGDEANVVAEDGVVETIHGRVQGHLLNGVWRFIDIPYGNISGIFKAPVEPDQWEGIHNVTNHDKRCPQLLEDGSVAGGLDCLTLSVFAPPAASGAGVLLHLHDGQFATGSGDPALYGPKHLVDKGVIVVLPNYRLGPLGFLCLDDENIPGNAALKDLTLALKWTSENIALFGGDPSNIVVSGIGMAGALAGYLAISPVSSEYVSKVITCSGSVLSHWAIERAPKERALELVNIVTGEDIDALHETDWHEMITAAKNMTFKPCVESSQDGFIDQTPWKTMQKKVINKTFMLGSANYAGHHDALENPYNPDNDDVEQLLPNDLYFKNGKAEKNVVAQKVKSQYFREDDESDDEESLTLYHTDASYLGPSIREGRRLVAAGAEVYIYEFSYNGELNIESLALPEKNDNGALRGDIVGYVFAQELVSTLSEDQHMIELMTDFWANYIKTGVPSSEGLNWQKLEKSEESEEAWLSIGAAVEPRAGLHLQRLALWTQLYRDYFVENHDTRNTPHTLYSIIIISILTLACKIY